MVNVGESVELTLCLSLAAPLPLREPIEHAGGGGGKE
jgi:hypothetical protein